MPRYRQSKWTCRRVRCRGVGVHPSLLCDDPVVSGFVLKLLVHYGLAQMVHRCRAQVECSGAEPWACAQMLAQLTCNILCCTA
jgi:hypothetical protein